MLPIRMISSFLLFFTAGMACAVETTGGPAHSGKRMALFAGGCFWCMQPAFSKLTGVIGVRAGYAGGTTADPRYEDYAQAGHIEVIEVVYDPTLISYSRLVQVFWRQIDPTDAGGQFADRGHAYSTAIYYTTTQERQLAEQAKEELQASGIFSRPIVTPILPAPAFYPAEGYHQDYAEKNPGHYQRYRTGSGRAAFLQRVWAEEKKTLPNQASLKQRLTPLQYKVTQEEGTEPPFANAYWDNKRAGLYVDIVSGEPLFSSTDKYDSGTGWPSFTRPLANDRVTTHEDRRLFRSRTEVRSADADSHLGHVFPDGPAPTGLRYCINSAALRFVPKEQLKEEGLAEYLPLFAPDSAVSTSQ